MKGTRLALVIATIAGLLTIVLITSRSGDQETAAPRANDSSRDLGLMEDGTLVVGSDIPFSPFEEGDPPEYEGFDIDLVDAVADKLDLETRIEDTSLDLILQGRGQFDLSISAVKITRARENRVDFSHPYFIPPLGLLVREDSEIATIDDVADGTVVGAEGGTDGASYASRHLDRSEVRSFPSAEDAFNALFNAQVDAVIADAATVEDAAETREDLEAVEIVASDEKYGIVVAEGKDALLNAVNVALREVKEDGTLGELYEEHFGVEVPDAVLTATHDAS